jgi:hypothetical protein
MEKSFAGCSEPEKRKPKEPTILIIENQEREEEKYASDLNSS